MIDWWKNNIVLIYKKAGKKVGWKKWQRADDNWERGGGGSWSVLHLLYTLLHHLPEPWVLHGGCHPLLVVDLFVHVSLYRVGTLRHRDVQFESGLQATLQLHTETQPNESGQRTVRDSRSKHYLNPYLFFLFCFCFFAGAWGWRRFGFSGVSLLWSFAAAVLLSLWIAGGSYR